MEQFLSHAAREIQTQNSFGVDQRAARFYFGHRNPGFVKILRKGTLCSHSTTRLKYGLSSAGILHRKLTSDVTTWPKQQPNWIMVSSCSLFRNGRIFPASSLNLPEEDVTLLYLWSSSTSAGSPIPNSAQYTDRKVNSILTQTHKRHISQNTSRHFLIQVKHKNTTGQSKSYSET